MADSRYFSVASIADVDVLEGDEDLKKPFAAVAR